MKTPQTKQPSAFPAVGESYQRDRFEVHTLNGDGTGWYRLATKETLAEAQAQLAKARAEDSTLGGMLAPTKFPTARIVRVVARCTVIEIIPGTKEAR